MQPITVFKNSGDFKNSLGSGCKNEKKLKNLKMSNEMEKKREKILLKISRMNLARMTTGIKLEQMLQL